MPRIKGSPAERARAREELRDELLTAARVLGEEGGGYDNVTIRKVADKVGYTAPVVYEHFADKRDLLLAVVDQGFADLAARLKQAEDLQSIAEAYWAFAAGRPHLYRLMSTLADVPFGTTATPASAVECFRLLKEALSDHPADATNEDDAYDEDAAADLFWAHLHGLVTLTLDGRVKGGPERAHKLLSHLVARHT